MCTNRQGQPIPAPMLSMDNTFMAKQRIACEGCRGKFDILHVDIARSLLWPISMQSSQETQVSPSLSEHHESSLTSLTQRCTGSRPVCYNCAKKGRTLCHYVKEIKRRGPGKKRLESEAKAKAEGYYTESTSGVPAQFAFWTGQGDGQ